MTSFIRIYRRDGQAMNTEEIDRLFNAAVQAYDRFGSYWVRILKKYRTAERCLDIQFGSSKRYDNLLEADEFHREYIVFERIADEGGRTDRLYQYDWNENHGYIYMKSLGKAMYAFDSIILHAEELPEDLKHFDFDQKALDTYYLNIEGTFESCTDRSFADLYEDSEFYGPCLGYDPNYASDYFVLQPYGELQTISIEEFKEYVNYPKTMLEKGMSISLMYNFRVVARLVHGVHGIDEYTAAFWDNCVNPEYLEFKKSLNHY